MLYPLLSQLMSEIVNSLTPDISTRVVFPINLLIHLYKNFTLQQVQNNQQYFLSSLLPLSSSSSLHQIQM